MCACRADLLRTLIQGLATLKRTEHRGILEVTTATRSGQGIFPVDSTVHGIRGLGIRQAFGKLHDRDEG